MREKQRLGAGVLGACMTFSLLAVVAPSLAGAQDGASDERCMGRRATIVSDEDEVRGTRGDDVIVASGPKHRVFGRSGNDVICGSGRGFLEGGRGNDRIRHSGHGPVMGGDGDDVLFNEGARVFGDDGDDRIVCEDGGRIRPGPGDDRVRALGLCGIVEDAGDDVMIAPTPGRFQDGRPFVVYRAAPRAVTADLRAGRVRGWGRDRLEGIEDLIGSRHDDVIIGDGRANRFSGKDGDDRIFGGAGGDSIAAEAGADVVEGGAGDDRMYGASFGDDNEPHVLRGGTGDDEIHGTAGDDEIAGGEGNDTYAHEEDIVSIEVDLTEGYARGFGNDSLDGIENVFSSAGSDRLIGDDDDNLLSSQEDAEIDGRGGDDTISVVAGGRLLDGGPGSDILDMSRTDPPIFVDLADGTLQSDGDEGRVAGFETVLGGQGDDRLLGSDGAETMSGSVGNDELQGRGGDDELNGDEGEDVIDGGTESDRLLGGSADDDLSGGAGDDYLDGGDGVDMLDGGDGTDNCLNGEVMLFCEPVRYFASPRPLRPGYSRPPNGKRADSLHASSLANRSR